MSSQAQIDANRLNAQKSTGPRTPDGRAAVRLNGVKHGLTAKTLILKGENESDFDALFDSLQAEHQPSTPTEELLVSQIAMAAWRLRRLYAMEASYYIFRMSEMDDYAKKYHVDDSCRLGLVANGNIDTIANIGRQEARLQRIFEKALQQLQRLRTQRPPEKMMAKNVEKPELGLVSQFEPQAPHPPVVQPETVPAQPPPPAPDINLTNVI
jgi:hypothetical protein